MSASTMPTDGSHPMPELPWMRVATSFDASSATLGLDRAVPLRGGGAAQLPSQLTTAVWLGHHPDLARAVAYACRAQAQAGRGWHAHGCIVMAGSSGSGRGHAARLLAGAAGLPLFVADASTPEGRAALRGDPEPGRSAFAPTALAAVAASRCANPAILVEGLREEEDLEDLLGPFVDPDRSPRFRSAALGATFDLSQVNWLLQVGDAGAAGRLPEGWASVVRFERPVGDARRALDLSIARALRDSVGGPSRADASAAVAWALDPTRPPSTIAEAAEAMSTLVSPIAKPVPMQCMPTAIASGTHATRTAGPGGSTATGIEVGLDLGAGTGTETGPTVVASARTTFAGHAANGLRPDRALTDGAAGATTIVVNGRAHVLDGSRVGHGDLARLAFPMLSEREGRALAAGWSGGPAASERGVLAFGRTVEIREGQRFNVVVTDKS